MITGSIHNTYRCGKLIILEYINHYNVRVLFPDTQYETTVQAQTIRGKYIKDRLKPLVYGVGFIGEGKYTSTANANAYQMWTGMLKRCYCPKYHKIRPTYKKCTVHEELRNFQDFAEFIYTFSTEEGLKKVCLDKDIKIPGNKEYTKASVSLVTLSENSQHATGTLGIVWTVHHKDGRIVTFDNQRIFAKKNDIHQASLNRVVLGKQKSCKGWSVLLNEGQDNG